jgi:CRP-like cAMP-binding protein
MVSGRGARARVRQGQNQLLRALGRDVERLRPYFSEQVLLAGQVLCEPGEEVRFVYFLHDGVVSKLSAFSDGLEIESALIGREGAVGAIAAIGPPHSVTRDVCHLKAHATRVPVARLREACRAAPHMNDVVVRYALWKLSWAIRSGACNACHSVQNRLCRWLLNCCDVLESREIGLSQEVFAKMLGAQRSSISPILQELKADGALTIGRSRITVRDRAVLLDRACECYAALRQDQLDLQEELQRLGPPAAPARSARLPAAHLP